MGNPENKDSARFLHNLFKRQGRLYASHDLLNQLRREELVDPVNRRFQLLVLPIGPAGHTVIDCPKDMGLVVCDIQEALFTELLVPEQPRYIQERPIIGDYRPRSMT